MLGIISGVVLQGGPAYAQDPYIQLIQDLKPDILLETAASADTQVVVDAGKVIIDSSASSDQSLANLPAISLETTSSAPSITRGLSVTSDGNTDTASIFQPTNSGGRVLTVIKTNESGHCTDFEFDVPTGTVLEPAIDGYYLVNGEEVILHLNSPWAIDSKGKNLVSSYTWDSGVLTQCVTESTANISYPILADPGWDYTYNFNLNKIAETNKVHLHSCFNCYFPVTGAPQIFPAPTERLPLWAIIGSVAMNMECRFNAEFNGTSYYGFSFLATDNHVDGLGSWILFEFKTISGVKKLVVSAHVVNDWMNNFAYRSGAQSMWQQFATNLNS
jgi:hypothetical protein